MPFQLGQRDLQSDSSSNSDSGAVRFQQQGSVDWTALGSNSLHASVQILSRISAAGIDPFTIVIGQAVCGTLVWRPEGRKRFDQALKSCRGLAGYRNVLWFGFGVKHVASILTSTDQGATCAALCACLAECYGSDMAAEVMMEMTKASKPSTETIPSLVQWRNLVNACAGLVSTSTFSIRAEQLMRLLGEWRIANEGRRTMSDSYLGDRGVAHKAEIAETLLGLAKLSRGILVQMTIIGGADAGFIAAIADWLLDLHVEIRGGQDQDTRFQNFKPEQKPQLLIIYDKTVPKDSMQAIGQTFVLPDGYHLVRRRDGNPQATLLSGRVPWDKALEYTFNRDFDRLMRTGERFGSAIGNAARIYQGLFEGEKSLPVQWLRNCRSYFSDSHGPAFVHFVLMRFPELEPLRDCMIRGARTSNMMEAGTNFDTQMNSIATACECVKCCPTEPENGRSEVRVFCLVLLAHTIINVSRALSGMVTELCPLRAGLEMMFWNCGRYDLPATARQNLIEEEKDWHTTASTRMLLQNADILFGGSRMDRSNGWGDWACALSDNGLCYFLDILVNPVLDAGRAARVHIIAGRIEHQGRAYGLLSDVDHNTPPFGGPGHPEAPTGRFLNRHLDEMNRSHGGRLEVLVTQRLDGLEVEYGVSKDSTIHLTFGPARALHAMCRGTGLVSCGRDSSCPKFSELNDIEKEISDCRASQKAICHLKEDQDEMVLVQGDSITRLAAAALTWDPIIQRDECLACSAQCGVGLGGKRITIILSQEYLATIKNTS